MDVQGPARGHALMHIAFRADASIQIGTGHIMRCLTLADVLREHGAQCIFICRQHPGHLLDLIRQRGHKVHPLPVGESFPEMQGGPAHAAWLGADWASDAAETRQALGQLNVDWLVVDHYALDHRWEQTMRTQAQQIMVIDDLADRMHDCDLLLDQNLGRTKQDYASLLKSGACTFIGPQYALLRPEFSQWREYSLARRQNPQLKNLLITMGGVDKGNATGQVLDALKLCQLPADLNISVIMGPHAPWLAQVQVQAEAMPWPTQVLAGVSNMAQLMADSDLAIGAAGSTSWERCCLGVPTIQLVLADNQKEAADALEELKAVISITAAQDLNSKEITRIQNVSTTQLLSLSTLAAAVCDGSGAPVIATELLKKSSIYQGVPMAALGNLRNIQDDELELMRSWRNSPAVRRNMYTRHEISSEEHQRWWTRTRQREDQQYFMYEIDGKPLGIVAFTIIDTANSNCSWAFYAAPDAPRGTGSKMEFLALDYVFSSLKLHKLHCEVLAFNTPVIKLHQKFGFQEEGVFRQHHRTDDGYTDIHRLGMIAHEWACKRVEMLSKLTANQK